MKPVKPRVRFCWDCGRKLYGNHHVAAILKLDKRERILHKQCYDADRAAYEPLETK